MCYFSVPWIHLSCLVDVEKCRLLCNTRMPFLFGLNLFCFVLLFVLPSKQLIRSCTFISLFFNRYDGNYNKFWQILTGADWKYGETLARLEKSKILKFCSNNPFRELLSKFPLSDNLKSERVEKKNENTAFSSLIIKILAILTGESV